MKKIFSIFLSLLLLINSFLKEKNFTHAYDFESLFKKYSSGFETTNFWWFAIPLFKNIEGSCKEADIKGRIEPSAKFTVLYMFQSKDGAVWGTTLIGNEFYFIPGKFLTFVNNGLPYTFRFKKCPFIYQSENAFENSITRDTPIVEEGIYKVDNNIIKGFDAALVFSKIKAMGYSGGYTFFVACLSVDETDFRVLCAKNEDLEEEPGKLDFDIFNEEFINNTGQQIKCDKDVSNHDNSDLIIEPGQKVIVGREKNDFYLLEDGKNNIFLVNKNLLVPADIVFFVMWGARIYDENFKSSFLMKGLLSFYSHCVLRIQNDFLIFKIEGINKPFAVNKVDVIPMKKDTEKFLKESVFEQAIVIINTCNKVYFDTFEKFFTTATLNSEKMPASCILQQIFIENEPWNNKSLMSCLEFVILFNLNPMDLILKNEDVLFIKKIFFNVILQEISKYLEEMPLKQGYEYELFYNLREEIARLL